MIVIEILTTNSHLARPKEKQINSFEKVKKEKNSMMSKLYIQLRY